MYQVYGITNCNTVKKTLDYFKTNGIPFEYHDYKKKGLTPEKLQSWTKQKGWEPLLNKKGTTWRSLDILQQKKIKDIPTAINYLLANTSAIKRPIIELDGKIIAIGFDESSYALLFH